MILNFSKQWLLAALLSLPKVNPQMPMPLFMPPMPQMPQMMPQMMPQVLPQMMPQMMPQMYYPPPPPPPVPMPFPAPPPIAFQTIQIQEPKKSPGTEKSEKDEKTIGIAIPMSFPAPMQFAMPPFPVPLSQPAYCMERPRPADCPPETLQLRSQPTGPGPQPGYQITRREPRWRPRVWRDKSYEGADFQGYSSELALRKIRRRRKPGRALRKPLYRKSMDSNLNYDDFAKPVLSYMSNDGDVKLEKPLSDDEAAELMEDEKPNQKVQVMTEEDSENRQSVKVVSSIDNKLTRFRSEPSGNQRRRQVLLKSGSIQHMLGEGKKELVFKPPNDKKIRNLSVSFQIT